MHPLIAIYLKLDELLSQRVPLDRRAGIAWCDAIDEQREFLHDLKWFMEGRQ